jgi:hypothetical protein
MITDETFVRTWLEKPNLASVAAELEITLAACSTRATLLRKAGVNLPKFTRRAAPAPEIDVESLNKLIAGD